MVWEVMAVGEVGYLEEGKKEKLRVMKRYVEPFIASRQ